MKAAHRPRYAELVSALGAIALALSVFLPWYGVSVTPSGISLAQQAGDQVAAQFGNAALQSYMSGVHANIAALAGRELGSMTAKDALTHLHVLLLLAGGLGAVLALTALGGMVSEHAPRGPLALLGSIAGVGVLVRVLHPPEPGGGMLALSPREGAWIALLASIAMVAGAVWPRRGGRAPASAPRPLAELPSLPGWAPRAEGAAPARFQRRDILGCNLPKGDQVLRTGPADAMGAGEKGT